MRRLQSLVALGAAALILACAPRDSLARIKHDYPGADEYRSWKNYVLVRFPVDKATGEQRGIILQKERDGWIVLGESVEGFRSMREVITYIPELDEDGVAAFEAK